MLTSTLVHGFAADPALPERDLLLDAAEVGRRLPELLGADVRSVTLVRAKYRIGESLRVVYHLDIAGRRQLIAARAFPAGGAASAYRRALPTGIPVDGLPPVLLDPACEAVWWTFPNDRRMRDIARLMNPAGRLHRWERSEVVEYAPERSVTVRALGSDGSTIGYAKSFAPDSVDVAALAARYRRVAAALLPHATTVHSPDALAWSVPANLLLLAPLPGLRWTDLPPVQLSDALGRLGAAIAALHDAPAGTGDGLRAFSRLALPRVTHSAELIGLARPDVAPLAARIAARLAGSLPPAEQPVLLHGDCHPKNALVEPHRIGLIDLDQAGVGAAANDLGSLLARLEQDQLLGGPPAAELGAAFLRGYADVRPLPAEPALRWYTAAALLAERAMRAVNRVHAPALERLEELLLAAGHTLDRGVPR